MTHKQIKNIIISAMLLGLGMVLPLLTGQIKEIGDSLLPMHLPVLLCGIICGWQYGATIGLVMPFLRSVTFGMPPIYPNAVWMAAELCAYGAIIGLAYVCIHKFFRMKKPFDICAALVTAMIGGRIVWGVVKAILLGIGDKPFTMKMFVVGGFVDALPGIIIQLVLVPAIVTLYERLERKGVI